MTSNSSVLLTPVHTNVIMVSLSNHFCHNKKKSEMETSENWKKKERSAFHHKMHCQLKVDRGFAIMESTVLSLSICNYSFKMPFEVGSDL